MDREKTLIALSVTLLLVISAVFGALAVTQEHEDYYQVNVEIVEPEAGSFVSGSIEVNVTFEANSAAESGTLLVDDMMIAYSKTTPFVFGLDTKDYLDGPHELTAIVTTQNGRFGFLKESIIINNGGTNINIRSPTEGATLSGQMDVNVDAVSPRGISYVEISLDGNKIGNRTVAPYVWSIDSTAYSNGEHILMAKAVDQLGVKAEMTSNIIFNNPFIIVDERGKSISFDAIPSRILSMGGSFTEIFYAIGADEHLVGVDSSSKYPAEVSEKTNIGSFYTLTNLEAILALNPDCVVTWTFATTTVSTLEAKGLKVVCYNPGSVNGVVSVINSIGNLTAHEQGAKVLVNDIRSRLDAVEQRVANIPDEQRPSVYFELRSYKSAGPGTIANELITIAGGENIYATSTMKYPLFNSEYIISGNPDVIVIENQSDKTNSQIEATAGWGSITAVQEHRILRINGELVSSTPRLVEAVEQMADYFFPS
jgi:iron complex transport system substrate-binding protein